MVFDRKTRIASSFGRKAYAYDEHADLQKDTARNLAGFLPNLDHPRILEIGCGTGFLTEQLFRLYPNGSFDITDLSPDMLRICSGKFADQPSVRFFYMDGEKPSVKEAYDLIISSMTVQWFSTPPESIKRLCTLLKPNGRFYYTALGHNSFAQWHEALSAINAPSGLLTIPEMSGIFHETQIEITYNSAENFLRFLKETGANQPKEGYAPLHSALLRKACRYFNEHYGGQITWHIVYGCLQHSDCKGF